MFKPVANGICRSGAQEEEAGTSVDIDVGASNTTATILDGLHLLTAEFSIKNPLPSSDKTK